MTSGDVLIIVPALAIAALVLGGWIQNRWRPSAPSRALRPLDAHGEFTNAHRSRNDLLEELFLVQEQRLSRAEARLDSIEALRSANRPDEASGGVFRR